MHAAVVSRPRWKRVVNCYSAVDRFFPACGLPDPRDLLRRARSLPHDADAFHGAVLERGSRGYSLVPVALRSPRQLTALVRAPFSSESWNWQFRPPDPPVRLLRRTWAAG